MTAFVGTALVARSQGEDAAEELPDGLMVLNTGFLGLGGRAGVVGYLRVADIRIQVGLRVADIRKPTDLTLHAELAGDAVAFTEVRQNISLRKRTSASVNWRPEPWDVAGERSVRQRTPNLAALIHEVVNRPDWREGNALVLLISGSGQREASDYDGSAGVFDRVWVAPRLYIELAEPSP